MKARHWLVCAFSVVVAAFVILHAQSKIYRSNLKLQDQYDTAIHQQKNFKNELSDLRLKNWQLEKDNQAMRMVFEQMLGKVLNEFQVLNEDDLKMLEVMQEHEDSVAELRKELENYKNRMPRLYSEAEYLANLYVVSYKDNPANPETKIESPQIASGFVINYEGKSYILTACHIKPEGMNIKSITAKFNFGKETQEMEMLGCNKIYDAALLKFKDPNYVYKLRPAKLGDSDKLAIGEEIFSLGSPLAIPYCMTGGIVSQKIFDADLNKKSVIHTAAINPGNSGGPLLNGSGEVVGMNVQAILGIGQGSKQTRALVPVPFSNTINDIKKILPELVKGESE